MKEENFRCTCRAWAFFINWRNYKSDVGHDCRSIFLYRYIAQLDCLTYSASTILRSVNQSTALQFAPRCGFITSVRIIRDNNFGVVLFSLTGRNACSVLIAELVLQDVNIGDGTWALLFLFFFQVSSLGWFIIVA